MAQPASDKILMSIELDREWTHRVVSHVRLCREPLKYLSRDVDGYASTSHFQCKKCKEVLSKANSKTIDSEEEENLVIRRKMLKAAAMGLPPQDRESEIVVSSATKEEIAETLEEDVATKTVEIQLDHDWTLTVADHVLTCKGGDSCSLKLVDTTQDFFELTDCYSCEACGEKLLKKSSKDGNSINSALFEVLLKDPPAMSTKQFYNVYRLSNQVCPSYEELLREFIKRKQIFNRWLAIELF